MWSNCGISGLLDAKTSVLSIIHVISSQNHGASVVAMVLSIPVNFTRHLL